MATITPSPIAHPSAIEAGPGWSLHARGAQTPLVAWKPGLLPACRPALISIDAYKGLTAARFADTNEVV